MLLAARGGLAHLLSLVFFFSGIAGLLYQVVWQRLLTVYYGVGYLSTTLIVSIYMLGLGLGALWGGRLADRTDRALRLYLLVELLLGLFGALSPFLLRLLGGATAGSSPSLALLCMLAFLAIPTLLMGTTLPLVVKIFNTLIENFAASVSRLYFLNTLGAALGALLAAYGVISFLGLKAGTLIAAGINLSIAGLIFSVARLRSGAEPWGTEAGGERDPLRKRTDVQRSSLTPIERSRHPWPYFLVGITGFLAIGYELVWFRIVEVLVKASPYAFATVLAVYLLGIALGSAWMEKRLRRPLSHPGRRFLLFQGGIALYTLLSILLLVRASSHPLFGMLAQASFAIRLHPSFILEHGPGALPWVVQWFGQVDIVLWPLFLIAAPTALMGAGFPLVSMWALSLPQKEGTTIGTLYFFNTVGNVLGGVVTGLLLLPSLGTERVLLFFGLCGLILALFGLSGANRWGARGLLSGFGVVMAFVFPSRGELFTALHPDMGADWQQKVSEGVEGVVVTYERGDDLLNFINGLGHGGRPGKMFVCETLEALALSPSPEEVLIIGYGTGAMTEAVLKDPRVRHITLVELNHTLMKHLSSFSFLKASLADPRLTVVMDDGRRFLLRTETRFDLVLIDPLRSTTAYSNNLYSREFAQLVFERLTKDGRFLLWMDEFRVLPATVATVFPYLSQYNYFAVAGRSPLQEPAAGREALIGALSPRERESVDSCDVRAVGDRADVQEATRGIPINTDWRPVTEYYLGLHVLKEADVRLIPSVQGK